MKEGGEEGSCCVVASVVASNPNIFPTEFWSRDKSEVKDFFCLFGGRREKITYSPSFSICFYWPD